MSVIRPARATLRAASRLALDLLAPRGCAACDADVRGDAPFCAACYAGLHRARPTAVEGVPVFAGTEYGDAVAAAIRRFKYSGRTDLAHALASLALDVVPATPQAVLVPVPLHPVRLAERGYNQSALLARELARGTGAALAPRALERRRATKQQARQTGDARLHNVAGAFAARQPRRLAGRRVLLVDDVVTTGATAAACIRALVSGGAEVAAVVAVALAGDGRTR